MGGAHGSHVHTFGYCLLSRSRTPDFFFTKLGSSWLLWLQDSYSAIDRPLVAPLLKTSFSKISFLSVKRCILLAECYGTRGGVLRPEGGGARQRGVTHRVRESVMETALKINPSLCVSSPPAWAQPCSVRGKAFMYQTRACFPVSVQPDKLKMLAT